jgi:predicted ATP-grasp superfamily ATP-dependent carboligase
MLDQAIQLDDLPSMEDPLLIAGFEGWGNALDLSRGMVDYLIEKLNGKSFGTITPDLFYRFDEHRPVAEIEEGILKSLTPPGGRFFSVDRTVSGRDIIVLKATEPSLRWMGFAEALVDLCQKTGVKTMISLGSMYDNVLHTDTVLSAVASSNELLTQFKNRKVVAVNFRGPSAIHTTLLHEAEKRGMPCVSLWCHCPFYLQGTTHFGLLSHLGSLLSSWGGFSLDTEELDRTWKDLSKQIQGIIDKNPELQAMINDLRKSKIKGSWDEAKKGDKVIHLEDFFKPK